MAIKKQATTPAELLAEAKELANVLGVKVLYRNSHGEWFTSENLAGLSDEKKNIVTYDLSVQTPVQPAVAPVPPAATPVTPAAAPVSPAAAPVPPAATQVTPAATPVTPAAAPVSPAAAPVPPAATQVTPAATPVTPAATPVTPAATPVTPAATPVTPEATTSNTEFDALRLEHKQAIDSATTEAEVADLLKGYEGDALLADAAAARIAVLKQAK